MISTAAGVCVQILQADGVRGLYRGCVTNLVRTTPAAAITFTSYEIISRNLACVVHAMDGDGGDGPPAPGTGAGTTAEVGDSARAGGPARQEVAAAPLLAETPVGARAHA